MATKLFFVHSRTQRRYEVLKMDNTAKTVTLKGELGTFDEPYDKDRFKQMGYTVEKVVTDEEDE